MAGEVVVRKEAPLVDASAPTDHQVFVTELETAEARAVVPEGEGQDDHDGNGVGAQLFGYGTPVGRFPGAAPRFAPNLEQKEEPGRHDVRPRREEQTDGRAGEDRSLCIERRDEIDGDRKSTRLNSSHVK